MNGPTISVAPWWLPKAVSARARAPLATPNPKEAPRSTRIPDARSGPAQCLGPPAARQAREASEAANRRPPDKERTSPRITAALGEMEAAATAASSGPVMNATSITTASSA